MKPARALIVWLVVLSSFVATAAWQGWATAADPALGNAKPKVVGQNILPAPSTKDSKEPKEP